MANEREEFKIQEMLDRTELRLKEKERYVLSVYLKSLGEKIR